MIVGTPWIAIAREVRGLHVRGLGPARRGDHAVPRVDRDGHAVGMTVHEPIDELPVADRGRADDDARDACLRERLGRVEVADAPAGLELDREPVGDRADVIEVRGPSGTGAVEVDDVQPLRAVGHEPLRRLER